MEDGALVEHRWLGGAEGQTLTFSLRPSPIFCEEWKREAEVFLLLLMLIDGPFALV